MGKLGDIIKNKIADFLPSEEPETEAERLYEEGKERVYQIHAVESDLFYVDSIWLEEGRLHIYGEFAKGDFLAGQEVDFLDNYGERLFSGKVEEVQEERPQSVKVKRGFLKTTPKIYLVLSYEEEGFKEDSFVYSNFLIKKK